MAPRTGAFVFVDNGLDSDTYYGSGNPQNLIAYQGVSFPLRIDLDRGSVRGLNTDRLYGVRGASGGDQPDVILGDEHANVLRSSTALLDSPWDPAMGGADLIRGRGGNDTLQAWGLGSSAYGDTGNDTISAYLGYGGAGNDELSGFPSESTDDTLIGGPGYDRADGLDGQDRCSAEVLLNCELPVS